MAKEKKVRISRLAVDYGSPLDLLESGKYHYEQTAILIYSLMKARFGSNEVELTYTRIANLLNRSVGTVSAWIQNRLDHLIVPLSKQKKRARTYQICPHQIDSLEALPPQDKLGNDKCCWVPNAVIEAFEQKQISARAFVIRCWLHANSRWTRDADYGRSRPVSQIQIAKAVRMSCEKVAESLEELYAAGLLKRLTPKNQIGVYQMLPILVPDEGDPIPKDPIHPPQKGKKTGKGFETKTHLYSDNRQYRMCKESGDIEKKRKQKQYSQVRDRERRHIPKAIVNFFEAMALRNRQLKFSLMAAAE